MSKAPLSYDSRYCPTCGGWRAKNDEIKEHTLIECVEYLRERLDSFLDEWESLK